MNQLILEVACADRWQVYYRFKDLGISCKCQTYQPLWVHIETPVQLLQAWSIVQAIAGEPEQLVNRLNRCWELSQTRHIGCAGTGH